MACLYSYTSFNGGTATGTDTNYSTMWVSWDPWINATTSTGFYDNTPPVFHAPVDKKAQREELQWKSKWGFRDFVDWVIRPRFTRRLRLPCADRVYGTTNGLRPVPMLC